jgi:hypothetical protein
MNKSKRWRRRRAVEIICRALTIAALAGAALATGYCCKGALNLAPFAVTVTACAFLYSATAFMADELRAQRLWAETAARRAHWEHFWNG